MGSVQGGMAAAVVGEVLYYLMCSEGVSFNTWSHTCGSWNFPKFLFKEGSLTLMKWSQYGGCKSLSRILMSFYFVLATSRSTKNRENM